MNDFKLAVVLILCICCCSSKPSNSGNSIITKNVSVLFIGNSLTYTNDLPKLVKNAAKAKGINLTITVIAYPNYAIIDHWNDGNVQKEISKNHYDFVLLQQGPSSQAYGREVLIESGKNYSILCENNSTKLAYFMVWPSLKYYHTFDGVIKNYRDAATLNNAILCPVGEHWKAHFEVTENFDYYGPDGFHPSLKGSQEAATIIVDHLFEK